jgi:hypothetical protein
VKLRITQLDESTEPALKELLPRVWEQDWTPDFTNAVFRWRYRERPSSGGTWLAFDRDECVAVIDSFLRPYRIEGRRILVRETCDWFCMPEYRPLGVGLMLLRKLMARPEPIASVGGSQATQALLPKLGWIKLSSVQRYVLPVSMRGVVGNVLRRRWPACEPLAAGIPNAIRIWPRRRPPPHRDARVERWEPGRPDQLPRSGGRGLVQVLDPADRNWMWRMPAGFAQPVGLVFLVGPEPVGFSLSLLEPAASGLDGHIVKSEIAEKHKTQPLVDWMMAETARRLAALGAGFIRCRASSPEKIAALRRTGFIRTDLEPTYWWPSAGVPLPDRVDIEYLRADDALPFAAARGLVQHEDRRLLWLDRVLALVRR